jgi:tRNA threonylcarbamoyladenosine biosynthesis protein TsaE
MIAVFLPDAAATEALGARLARLVPAGCVIHLRGDLGTGKTTLVRGFLRALGFRGPVRSPTYTLIEPYTVESGQVLHCDLYRLGDPLELEYLGLRDFIDEQHILLVEWPERGGEMTPAADLDVLLLHADSSRSCELSVRTPRGEALLRSLSTTGWPLDDVSSH